MSKFRYGIVGIAAMAVLASGMRSPAFAAASFTWSFKGDYGVYSRHFAQPRKKDIYVEVKRWSPCVVNGDRVDVYVYLYKSDKFDNQVGGRKRVSCTGVARWGKVNRGTYYFRLVIEGAHRDQGTTFRASGRTFYDGSAP